MFAAKGTRGEVSPAQRSFLASFVLPHLANHCGYDKCLYDLSFVVCHIILVQVFELVCARTPHYFQASNTAEWVYYILEMLKKRAGDEAEANKAQSALSTAGAPSRCGFVLMLVFRELWSCFCKYLVLNSSA